MKTIKFKEEGRWADPVNPRIAQIQAKAGDIAHVSDELAELAIDTSNAVLVEEEAEPEAEKEPAKDDKSKAEGNPAQKDKAAATKK